MKQTPVRFRLVLSLLTALLLAGCADTKMEKTWTAPSAGALHFKKLFVFAMTKDDINRRLAEIAMRDAITQVPVTTSFQLLPDILDVAKREKVFQAIQDSGADGLVVMRLVYTDTEVSTSGNGARAMDYLVFSDYYGAVYDVGAYYSMDRRIVSADSIFGIETRIFDVKTQKLLWSGQTHSTKNMYKSHDIEGIVTDVANTLRSELKSQGLIP